jgi:hypothetical protein
MNDDALNSLAESYPKKVKERKKPFVSQGYQTYRDEILIIVKNLSFGEKFYLIKKTDKDLLKSLNKHTGTKAVHTLEYIKKIPSRKKELTSLDECILLLRSLKIFWARNDYYNERRKKMIRIVK